MPAVFEPLEPRQLLSAGAAPLEAQGAPTTPLLSIAKTRNASEANGQTTGKGVFTVTRAGFSLAQPLLVHYSLDPASTATPTDDFTALSGAVTILANKATATIDVMVADDNLAEDAESVIVNLEADPAYRIAAGKGAATTTIADNEPAIFIAKAKDANETQGQTTGKGIFTVTRQGGSLAQPLVVRYTLDPASTASPTDDFTALSGTVTLLANKATATIEVMVVDDSLAENAESVILGLAADPSYRIAAGKGAATIAIADNESTVSIAKTKVASETNGQAAGKGVFTVTRAGGSFAQPLVVRYTLDAASTATPTDDFTPLSGTVTLPANKATATIEVMVADDSLAESVENVILGLEADPSYRIAAGKGAATITIADNEPTVSIAKTRDASETNGQTTGKGVFTVTRTGGSLAQPLEVLYNIDPASTATPGDDFTPLSGTVTIPANKATATIDVMPLGDTAPEGNETVVVALQASPSYRLAAAPARITAGLSIVDGKAVDFLALTGFDQLGASWHYYATDNWSDGTRMTANVVTSIAPEMVDDSFLYTADYTVLTSNWSDPDITVIDSDQIGWQRRSDGLYITDISLIPKPGSQLLGDNNLLPDPIRICPNALTGTATSQTVPIHLDGGDMGQIDYTLTVTTTLNGKQKITEAAGTFDTYKATMDFKWTYSGWEIDDEADGVIDGKGPRVTFTGRETRSRVFYAVPGLGVVRQTIILTGYTSSSAGSGPEGERQEWYLQT
jgi:hypothetical protein